MRFVPSGKQYIRLIDALKEGPATAPELSADLGISLPVVSKQLSRAAQDGLIERKLAPALNLTRGRKPYLYSTAG